MCIDHDHITGIVRGLLCYKCNTGIGKFSDKEQQMVFANMKARQRVYTLTGDVTHTAVLFEAGYHSAMHLVQDDIATIQHKSGLSEEIAKQSTAETAQTLERLRYVQDVLSQKLKD